MVGQSGGMMLFANGALNERGIVAEYLITSGNEAGLSVGDYIAFFADQPELKVIVIYVEAIVRARDVQGGVPHGARRRQAHRRAEARPVGRRPARRRWRTPARSRASIEAFDAVAGEAGVVRADTLDDRRGDDGAARLYRRAAPDAISAPSRCRARSAGCCSTAPRRTACISAAGGRRRRSKLNAILERRLAGVEPDRRRLWRAHQRRQLHQLDRRHAGRPERRHRAGAGADPARARLRPRRELHPPAGGLCRHPGEEADRVLRADLARPYRLQPRAARRRRRTSRSCRRRTRRCARSRRWRGATSWSGWRAAPTAATAGAHARAVRAHRAPAPAAPATKRPR